jgi:hypothetical protein
MNDFSEVLKTLNIYIYKYDYINKILKPDKDTAYTVRELCTITGYLLEHSIDFEVDGKLCIKILTT